MKSSASVSYRESGVLTNDELGLVRLLEWVRQTDAFRRDKATGNSDVGIGYFANVIDLGRGMGLALTTDGVGTKVLIAQMLGRYDTIGIDCVAMNVNDLICVGAEPVSMLDYIAIERASPDILEAIGQGLHEGARRAGVNIVGGEISQLPELIRGHASGGGLDLVGMCVGVVPLEKVNVGQAVQPGDVIVGLQSSGIHSNGLTLARKALFDSAGFTPDTHREELGRTIGEELLEPTLIYVPQILELQAHDLPLKALVNITSDGFLNLTRIRPAVGFRLRDLPKPQPIFQLIQASGRVSLNEMFRVFNMGIGFCVIVPPDRDVIERFRDVVHSHGIESFEIGEVIEDLQRRVHLEDFGLVGHNGRFFEV
ncbi:MAG: phosphoribosylformylglycinamidine cyclo-ligase [Gammaproteobacteria bacterium]